MRNWLVNRSLVPSCRELALIFVLFVIMQTSGCTVVGLAIGAGVDSNRPDTNIVESNYLQELQENKPITLSLKDGKVVNGICVGPAMAPDSLYATYFKRSDTALNISPFPGDQITVTNSLEESFSGTFLGYDEVDEHKLKKILSRSPFTYGDFVPIVFHLRESKTDKRSIFQLNTIRSISGQDSTNYNPSLIRTSALDNVFPLYTVLNVTNQSGNQYIQVTNINRLEQPNSNNSKWKFMAIGAAIDIGIILVIALTFELNMDFGGGFQ